MRKNTNVTYFAEGLTEIKGEKVKGVLTILGADFEHIEKGFYISNGHKSPFAYKVDPNSVVILGDYIVALF